MSKAEEILDRVIDNYADGAYSKSRMTAVDRLMALEAVKQALNIADVGETLPAHKAALKASVNAIYFNDGSDYLTAHYEVVCSLTELEDPNNNDIRKLFKELNPE